jgi:hypothetical protein
VSDVLNELQRRRSALDKKIFYFERKSLKRERRRIENRLIVLNARRVRFLLDQAEAQLDWEASRLEGELHSVRSRQLVLKAQEVGVELKPDVDWWLDEYLGVLSNKGITMATKLIRSERRQNVEWWVKVCTPLIAALISLLGLIVALVTVSKK